MPTLNIKDPEVHRLATLLAQQRHTSATAAVRQALNEALARDTELRAHLAEDLLGLAAAYRARGGRPLADIDLYDEHGLPR